MALSMGLLKMYTCWGLLLGAEAPQADWCAWCRCTYGQELAVFSEYGLAQFRKKLLLNQWG